ncbi:hypothetical protein ABTY20_22695 [Streptomyces sp. NPDC126497]|uniref:hypothetical protein n=1 Tax=Streptomyces sp. NPDC126497 TaxID=3155313 RepID=UPI003332872C
MPRAHIELDRRAVIAPVRRRDLARRPLESDRAGPDEFAGRLEPTDSEPMPAADVAARGLLPAPDLLEYAHHPPGTTLSDPRIANGTPEPHDVRMRCLGNGTDGPRQAGSMTADDHGKPAARTAAATKRAGQDLEVVATADHAGHGRRSARKIDVSFGTEPPPPSWTAVALR